MNKLTIKVDTKLCIGAASCVGIAPDLFRLDEENVAYLIDPATGEDKTSITIDASDGDKALIEEAIENCPTSAISLVK
jgi:ferredoxin